MSQPQIYQDFHPRWYRPRMSTWWWLGRRTYVAFILRELSSVFVAWTVVFLLLLVRAVAGESGSYAAFLDLGGQCLGHRPESGDLRLSRLPRRDLVPANPGRS
jgi:hypothetical protein